MTCTHLLSAPAGIRYASASTFSSTCCRGCGRAQTQTAIKCRRNTAQQVGSVGRIFNQPEITCGCGGRVLELLYCQSCGEVLLGGYRPEESHGGRDFLVPFLADLERLPDRVITERTAVNYVVYWPRPPEVRQPVRRDRTWGGLTFAFKRAELIPQTGMVRRLPQGTTGWALYITGADNATLERVQGLPLHCPGCDEVRFPYRNRRRLPPTDPAGKRSPIRTMGLGFSRVAQVLSGAVLSQLPADQRRLVVFSDSRQDAARIGPDLARNHFQDILRAELVAALDDRADLSLAERAVAGDTSEEAVAAYGHLRQQMPALADALARPEHLRTDADKSLIHSGQWELEAPTIEQLIDRVELRLATLGLNPGGPGPSLFESSDGRHWHELYSWDGTRMMRRAPLPENLNDFRALIRGTLTAAVLSNLFSGVGRDIESLVLAMVAPLRADRPPAQLSGLGQDTFAEVAHSALRILCLRLRFPEAEREPSTSPGGHLRSFFKTIADARGLVLDDLIQDVANAVGTPTSDWLFHPHQVRLLRPSPLPYPSAPLARDRARWRGRTVDLAVQPMPPRSPAPLRRHLHRLLRAVCEHRNHSAPTTPSSSKATTTDTWRPPRTECFASTRPNSPGRSAPPRAPTARPASGASTRRRSTPQNCTRRSSGRRESMSSVSRRQWKQASTSGRSTPSPWPTCRPNGSTTSSG